MSKTTLLKKLGFTLLPIPVIFVCYWTTKSYSQWRVPQSYSFPSLPSIDCGNCPSGSPTRFVYQCTRRLADNKKILNVWGTGCNDSIYGFWGFDIDPETPIQCNGQELVLPLSTACKTVFGEGGLDELEIWGKAGNDDIRVGDSSFDYTAEYLNGTIALHIRINGGPGNDDLRVPSGGHEIFGGSGRDDLYGEW